ncbi:GntR family transcriptional regulator [Marinobacter mobilis]|uniref:DNA-binding transcriptional regulator, GntR family n=1 Tax=Marinobacter mobilis TaxID=488533 RepID=A0A1H3BLH3_9GAMM|nr:GntR family transcriptional regulator [Marinobacter mobilis]SDX42800.1 DNA-binding transcriptional regulator, GntR family [Marinobacter mobilis]
MQFQAPESLSEQIAQFVGQRIISGQLAPGERIQELKVAGELDVSRGSVREALLILERRHLVEIFPRRGAVVSQLTPNLVNGLYDIYIELLCMLGRNLLERWSTADLAGLSKEISDLQIVLTSSQLKGRESWEKAIEAGFNIMRSAYRMVANPFLEETLENFKPAISRTYYVAMQAFDGELSETIRLFQRLAGASTRGDVAGLDQALREFGEHQRQQVLKVVLEKEHTA